MYLTIYTKKAPHQITFEELLTNPYISPKDFETNEKKKVTIPISEEYAARLWEKTRKTECPPYIETILNQDFKTEEHYSHFRIPKKSNPNKMRKIDAPDDELGNIQSVYKNYMEQYLNVLPHKAAHAYVAKRSTITACETHQRNNSKWYLQIDLKDFFNSINGEWLKRMMLEVYPFAFIDESILDAIIKSALLNNELPQGSHLSPTLTNIVMTPIDHEITETLHNYNRHHFVYTRYADDITISCKEKFNAREILNVIKEIFKKWEVPFRINNEKTRFGSNAGRNYHLGLIINKDNQISVGHEKNNKFKAMIFNYCTVGDMWEIKDVQKMLGLISYYKSIEPDFVEKTLNKYNNKFNINIMRKAINQISS